MSDDSFKTRKTLKVGKQQFDYFSLPAAEQAGVGAVNRLPMSLKILLENLLRFEDGNTVRKEDIKALGNWAVTPPPAEEIAYRPARVLMQDFTGVPGVADLAAMRSAVVAAGLDPSIINPLSPVDLVIDHSVMVDKFGTSKAFEENVDIEMERNRERYRFLRWGQTAFDNFRVVPPGTGICHQVNLEYLAKVVWTKTENGKMVAYPDTLVGTDSHTTMINGLGVLGWGVGGIEAEAAMLGQPISMLIPDVIGFRLTGKLKEGITATDLVLRVVELLRKKGVVDKFVDRCRNDQLSEVVRPSGGHGRARRSVRKSAGHVARCQFGRSRLYGYARARPRHRRAESRRSQAPAGPRCDGGAAQSVRRRTRSAGPRQNQRCAHKSGRCRL